VRQRARSAASRSGFFGDRFDNLADGYVEV
jgi:hypothetical protein